MINNAVEGLTGLNNEVGSKGLPVIFRNTSGSLSFYLTTGSVGVYYSASLTQPADFAGTWSGVTGSCLYTNVPSGFSKSWAPFTSSKLNIFSSASVPINTVYPYSGFVIGPLNGTIPAGNWNFNLAWYISNAFYKDANYVPALDTWISVFRSDDTNGTNLTGIISTTEDTITTSVLDRVQVVSQSKAIIGVAMDFSNQYLVVGLSPGVFTTFSAFAGTKGDLTQGRVDLAMGSGSYITTPGFIS